MEKIYPGDYQPEVPRTSIKARLAAAWQYLLHQFRARPWRTTGLTFAAGVVLLLLYTIILIPFTPSIEDLRQIRISQPSELRSSDGHSLGRFSPIQQERIKLDRVSPHVIKALIATEDHRFYEHHGVDFKRTASAVLHTLTGDAQGGSTLTQQLARNLFPEEIGRSRNINRKLKEVITAFKIEHTYSKQQILETYLNTMPFLYNVFGIELAAKTYFDKSAAELNLLESATLVGMLKGTSYYNPVVNPERAVKRRNVVLGQMVKHQQLTEAQYKTLRDQPLQVRFQRPEEQFGLASHFAAHARKWLIEWADQHDYDLYSDGLIVHTTLDFSLQKAAVNAVERQADALQNIADVEWGRKAAGVASYATASYAQLRKKVEPFEHFWNTHGDMLDTFIRETPEYRKAIDQAEAPADALTRLKNDPAFIVRLRAAKTRLEAGFVALDPATGEVRAWVGSRDFQRDQFDHVAQAERQPGSTFKPIVYGAALEQGLSPDRQYLDSPVEIKAGDGTVWRPTDMSGSSGGTMSLRDGLVYSKNTITVQVMRDTGLPNVIKLARAVGVNQSKLDPVPSLALGTSPVTLLEMVSAYSTIAQEGAYRKPVFIKRITDRNGKVLAEFGSESTRAMSAESAIELIDMMRGVVNRGTGQAVKTRFGIVADIAGKTGTTQNNTDGWFILMHPNLVAGSWVGFNDTRVTMRSNYWGQGGHNAILVVGDFFREALKTRLIDVKAEFPRPVRAVAPDDAPDPEDWHDQFNGREKMEPPASITAGNDGVIIIERPPGPEGGSPKTAEEVGRIMRGMGRDPITGTRVEPGRSALPEREMNAVPAQ